MASWNHAFDSHLAKPPAGSTTWEVGGIIGVALIIPLSLRLPRMKGPQSTAPTRPASFRTDGSRHRYQSPARATSHPPPDLTGTGGRETGYVGFMSEGDFEPHYSGPLTCADPLLPAQHVPSRGPL